MNDTCNILQQLLRNTFELSMKVRQFHWNIIGCHFLGDHKFLDDLRDSLDDNSDVLAELIRQSEGVADISQSIEKSKIDLAVGTESDSATIFADLFKDYTLLTSAYTKSIKTLESTCGCPAIVSDLEAILSGLNKDKWFISSKIK